MSTVRIQVRRGTSTEWTNADTALNASGGLKLAAGEIGLESDTGTFKFGDGTTRWSSLDYALENTLGDYVLLADVGVANGVAGLNSSGKVPASQLDISELSQDAVNTALVAGTGISKTYDDSANTITLAVNASTTNISEGTNLYFTDERAQDAVNTAIVAGSNITKAYDDSANTITLNLPSAVSLTTSLTSPTVSTDNLNVYTAANIAALTVEGNLTVNGTATTVNSTNVSYDDPMIYIGDGNQSNSLDLGIVGAFNNGTYQHTGLVKDATDGTWRLFSGVVAEPTTVIDFTTYTKDNLQIGGLDAVSATIGNATITSATIGDVSNAELQYVNGVTSAIQTQIDAKAPIASPTFTGTVSLPSGTVTDAMIADQAITSAKIANGAIIDEDVNASAAIAQSKISGLTSDLAAKAPLSGPTFTGTVVLPSTTSVGDVSATEIGYLNGVTSGVQSQLGTLQSNIDAKAPITAPTFTGIVTLPSTTSIGNISDTEIGYLDGVTSAIQTQIDAKASSTDLSTHASDTTSIHGIADTADLATKSYADTAEADAITAAGTAADTKISTAVAALTKSSVGLTNVDNTSDANKPISSATQTALDLKANLSAPTFTGTVTSTNDVVVNGNLTVNGTTFNASSTSITIEDNLVQLAHQNAANTVDLGIVVGYNDGAAKHSGIVRDVSADKWKLFKGVTTEPSTTVDFTEGSLDALQVGAFEATTVTPSSGVVFSDGTQTLEGVPSRTPIVQKTASYTLSSLTERDDLIEMYSASAGITLTIPADSTLNFPIGTSIDILQTGAGQVTIAGTGFTPNATPGLKLRTQWSSCTLFKRAADTWVVYGDLTA